jgi:hypothetical protein
MTTKARRLLEPSRFSQISRGIEAGFAAGI